MYLELVRINAQAAQRAAGPQASETIFKCLLHAERFDRDVGAAADQAFHVSEHICLLGIEDDIGANPTCIRTGSLSTPMINDAPISFAPAVEQRPIGPCAKTTTVSPILILADSAPLNPVEAISARRMTCSSLKSSGIFARFACAFGTRKYSACAPLMVFRNANHQWLRRLRRDRIAPIARKDTPGIARME